MLLSFNLLPLIPHGTSLQIYYSEIIKILLFLCSRFVLNISDGNMNQLSRKNFVGEVDIKVGKVALSLDARYVSE